MSIQERTLNLQQVLESLYDTGEAAAITGWIMESLTGMDALQRRMNGQQQLDAGQELLLAQYTEALKQHIPVQYVLGESYFYGYTFEVSPAVLIPRPETEELVDRVLRHLESQPHHSLRVLEVGTGSGCISIALKKKWPQLDVIAIDISDAALQLAEANARRLEAPVTFRQVDFLDEGTWPELGRVDLIVSNPPYILPEEQAHMQAHVLEQEPHQALFVTDGDPQQFYRKIADYAARYLQPSGTVFLELNQRFATDTATLYQSAGWTTVLIRDLNDNDRMLQAWR